MATLEKAFYGKNVNLIYRSIKEETPPEIERSFLLNSVLNRYFLLSINACF